jgi:hypothetical protein
MSSMTSIFRRRKTHALRPARRPSHCRAENAVPQRGIPAIYVNDNFGRWQSDFEKLLSAGIAHPTPGISYQWNSRRV